MPFLRAPAIAFIYFERLATATFYAQLILLYSLSMAIFFSLAKTGLTRPHAIFVVIAVASPSAIYLWYLGVRSLFDERVPLLAGVLKSLRFPLLEVYVKVLCLVGFTGEVTLLYSMTDSWEAKILQRSCDRDYLRSLISNLLPHLTLIFECLLGRAWVQISHLRARKGHACGECRLSNVEKYVYLRISPLCAEFKYAIY
jgi:hypothetical protein